MKMTYTKRICGIVCTLLAGLVIVPIASGQEKFLDSRVTLFGSASVLKGERNFTIGGTSFRSAFASGGKLGFRGTMNLTNHWSVEGVYSFGANNLRIVELGATPRERDYGVRVRQVTGNALYFLNQPGDKIRLFITTGLGLTRFSPTDNAKVFAATVDFVDSTAVIGGNTKFNFNFGGGAEAKLANHFGVRFDVRDHITQVPRFGVPQNPTPGVADYFPVDGRVHNIETSIGIVFHLAR